MKGRKKQERITLDTTGKKVEKRGGGGVDKQERKDERRKSEILEIK
jgi:hypothetical protein